jgi:hypothetical protein
MADAIIEGRQGTDGAADEQQAEEVKPEPADVSEKDIIEVKERLHEAYESDGGKTVADDE